MVVIFMKFYSFADNLRINIMKRYFLIILLFLTACAAASIPSLEKKFRSIGMNADQMVVNFGIPQNKYKSDKVEAWEYYNDIVSTTQGRQDTYLANEYEFLSSNLLTRSNQKSSSVTHQNKTTFYFQNGEVIYFKSE